MNEFGVLLLGFLLGLKHAAEADHLAAVATIAARRQSLAHGVRLGIAWGLGHTVTLLAVCGTVLALGAAFPPWMDEALELAVGTMLVILGIDVLRRLLRQRIHVHVHRHDRARHAHAHSHAGEASHAHDPRQHRHAHAPPLRALAVGMVHGMAGSAALVVLSLGAVHSWLLGLLYVTLFGIGSIVGMALLSVAIAIPLQFTARHVGWLYNGLIAAVGGFSLALGLHTLLRLGAPALLS